MADPNEQVRIQEFAHMGKNNSKVRWIWSCLGIDSVWNLAFAGILVCALLLALPPLVVLSALWVVFSVPFGFVFAVYSAINEIMSILLGEVGTAAAIGGQLGIINEVSKDFEGVIEVEEYRKKTDDIDIQVVKEMDTFRLGMTSTEDNVEREKLGKVEKTGIRGDEKKQAEDENELRSTWITSPFLSRGSSDFGNLDQLIAPAGKEASDGLQEDCGDGEEQSPKIEPGELVRETVQMFESVKNEGEVGIENLQQTMEEATSILPTVSGQVHGAVLDLERVKLLFIEDRIDDVPRLQTINEQLETNKEKKREESLASLQVEIEHTTNTTMKVIPQKAERLNPIGDIANATYRSMYQKKFGGTGARS